MRNKQLHKADYIIVGGGTAGIILANRLSAISGNEVLLLEAGGEARSLLVQLPVGLTQLVGREQFDWMYPAAADPSSGSCPMAWCSCAGVAAGISDQAGSIRRPWLAA